MLPAKVKLVGISIFDMGIIVPVHPAGEERRGSRQTGGATASERILSVHQRTTVCIRSRPTRHVQVAGDQLTDSRPVAFDVLRHLADSSPVVVDNSGASANDALVPNTIGEPDVRPDIRVRVVRNSPTRIYHDM